MDLLLPGAAGQSLWQLGLTLVPLVFLVLVAKTYGIDFSGAASRDPRITSLGLFVVLPLVLWGCMILGPADYLGHRRYFLPIVPLSVFVVYSFASFTDPKRRSLTRWLQIFGAVYLTAYVATNLTYSALFFVPGERGTRQLQKLMGADLSHWPSRAVNYEFYPARNFVLNLLKEQPNTVFLTSKAGWFHWDPAIDQSRLRELRCWDLHPEYLTGPARIIILTFDLGEPQELWYFSVDGTKRADCFEQLPDLQLLNRFPDEGGVKVLEARIAAGRRVTLRPKQ